MMSPNEEGMAAVKLLAQLEGILLDPVYTGKAMAGLIEVIVPQDDVGFRLQLKAVGHGLLQRYHFRQLVGNRQCEDAVEISSVVVASGSAGTHAGLAVGLEQLMPQGLGQSNRPTG
jgi:1-aminocyclopropane-1-carboxylate deaminase/D-cysteine desulfhydrase-like pyridoxal-dependent ACC family enzyme